LGLTSRVATGVRNWEFEEKPWFFEFYAFGAILSAGGSARAGLCGWGRIFDASAASALRLPGRAMLERKNALGA